MRPSIARAILLLPLTLVMGACGDDAASTPTAPTTTTVSETFSGTLNINGAVTHNFLAGSFGTVTATLSSVTPDSTVAIGMSLGTWNGIACQIVLAADKALQATVVTGNVSTVGNLCVRLYDVGNITEPTSYEVQVVHP